MNCAFTDRVSGDAFLSRSRDLQTEAFGNSSLFVLAKDAAQLSQIAATMEGNLTGTIYSALDGRDDRIYDQVAPVLRQKVGRLLNDRMPTGVAVSPAMVTLNPSPLVVDP